jgi:molybdate transport system substrate-binding protein
MEIGCAIFQLAGPRRKQHTRATYGRGGNTKYRRLALHLALAMLLLWHMAPGLEAQQPLRVAAAADLEPVLPALLAAYRAETGMSIEASYQSSSTLAAQIENGAPFDLFLSADLSFPEKLIADGLGDSDTPVPYARGTLVLWTRKDSHFPHPSLEVLRDPMLKRLAIANPLHAPYGRAAMASLTSLGLASALKSRLVTAENISQAAQFADSGNADAGLLSLTSALTDRLRSSGSYFEMPASSYPPIQQGAVVLRKSSQRDAAHRFLDYLRSPAVVRQLADRGLKPVR